MSTILSWCTRNTPYPMLTPHEIIFIGAAVVALFILWFNKHKSTPVCDCPTNGRCHLPLRPGRTTPLRLRSSCTQHVHCPYHRRLGPGGTYHGFSGLMPGPIIIPRKRNGKLIPKAPPKKKPKAAPEEKKPKAAVPEEKKPKAAPTEPKKEPSVEAQLNKIQQNIDKGKR